MSLLAAYLAWHDVCHGLFSMHVKPLLDNVGRDLGQPDVRLLLRVAVAVVPFLGLENANLGLIMRIHIIIAK